MAFLIVAFPVTAPASRLQLGGVAVPKDQSEALWISFAARDPCAVKIAAGKINVVPGQPWLDGFPTGAGLIRPFVALPLGAGDSVEEQLTGRADRADCPAGMRACLPRARF